MTSQAQISATGRIHDTVILGAGFGGIGMGIRLLQDGRRDFVILEKGSEVGGTWYYNQYPGAECDVQSHMYSYSFAGKADWNKRYGDWREIHQYILDVTERYGLRPHIRLNQEVVGARFDPDAVLWRLTLASGEIVQARHFVMASGPLHVPQIPNIPGLDTFRGKVFHSAQWDHDYDLDGKTVVSIGTGGSAIQYAPAIAPRVKQLYVFQRTPAWVIPRDERRYPELEKKLYARFPLVRKLHRARCYWTNESRVWPIFNPRLARTLQNVARAFIHLQVKDRETARRLTPDYTIGCKRVLISNAWYPMFNRDNVELVTEGIREIRAHSVVTTDGVERPCDCIILGTGFVTDPRIYLRNFPVEGLPGHVLADDWKNGAEGYYGTCVTGYPNMFQLLGPNSGLGHNSLIFMIEAQSHYILECMKLKEKAGAATIMVRPEAQRRFNDHLQRRLEGTVWSSGCQSWYQQDNGRNFAIWPASTWRYWLETRRVREQDFLLAGGERRPVRGKRLRAVA